MIEQQILDALLNKGNALTALEIRDACQMREPPYAALRQMEQRGLIESWHGDERPVERGGARRKYYAATVAGMLWRASRMQPQD